MPSLFSGSSKLAPSSAWGSGANRRGARGQVTACRPAREEQGSEPRLLLSVPFALVKMGRVGTWAGALGRRGAGSPWQQRRWWRGGGLHARTDLSPGLHVSSGMPGGQRPGRGITRGWGWGWGWSSTAAPVQSSPLGQPLLPCPRRHGLLCPRLVLPAGLTFPGQGGGPGCRAPPWGAHSPGGLGACTHKADIGPGWGDGTTWDCACHYSPSPAGARARLGPILTPLIPPPPGPRLSKTPHPGWRGHRGLAPLFPHPRQPVAQQWGENKPQGHGQQSSPHPLPRAVRTHCRGQGRRLPAAPRQGSSGTHGH